MSLAKAKTRLPSENVAPKGEIVSTVRKCRSQRGLQNENVARYGRNVFIDRIRSSQNENFAINANTVLRRRSQMRIDENVGHKVENAITERKRRLQSEKRVYRAKTLLPSEHIDRKSENAFTERNLRSRSRKRVYRAKTS